ncbi:DUF692 domain-containing protein [Amphritea sp.]|uniref:MNIO family bufferin maturase n=1 Tax=Amphritea sp. TaxID=1872502 RepID=UPI003D0FE9AE
MNDHFLGFGLGLRTQHFQDVLDTRPDVDWFEIISENFMVAGGKPKYYLHAIREQYPMVMHGVSMSIGSTEPLDKEYLQRLKLLANEVQPHWISDHLCWTGLEGVNSHDLLPMPYTEEAIEHIAGRIMQVQEILGRQLLLENVSSYISYTESAMSEWEFYSEVVERADCLMLLDINNIYVSSRNHNFDAQTYLNSINPERVRQFHLAGHSDYGTHVIDTHDHDICDPVWQLYCQALHRFGAISTMIERDDNIPPLKQLLEELQIARDLAAAILPQRQSRTPVPQLEIR